MSVAAVVARTTERGLVFLADPQDRLGWATAEQDAATFQSTREAMRVASRLPAKLRAFSLPVRYAA
jgi:hypothetical protein